jgi:hypothetical protein
MSKQVIQEAGEAMPTTSKARPDVVSDLMPSDEDLLYEEEILRNPFALRMWLRYIEARKDAPEKRRFLLFERAIQKLPGSYKVGVQSTNVCTDGTISWHTLCSY